MSTKEYGVGPRGGVVWIDRVTGYDVMNKPKSYVEWRVEERSKNGDDEWWETFATKRQAVAYAKALVATKDGSAASKAAMEVR